MPTARKAKRLVPRKLDVVFSAFIEVTSLITTGASIAKVSEPILSCACALLGGRAAFAILAGKNLYTKVSYLSGGRRARPPLKEEMMYLSSLAGKIYKTSNVTVVRLANSNKQLSALAGVDLRIRSGKVIAAPLKHKREKIGVMGVITPIGRSQTTEALDLFNLLVQEAGVAIKNAKEFERTQTLSITDGLTGAYNYRFLIDAMRKEIGRSERFADSFSIIMIDVDNLKEYNDIHGHLGGSEVIRQVSRIASSKLRSIDMLCKYGGDEFVAVLPRTPKDGAATAAERVRQSIEVHEFPGERLTGKITTSLGIASFPEDGETVEELISSADEALYRAKRYGRNTVWLSGKKAPYSRSSETKSEGARRRSR